MERRKDHKGRVLRKGESQRKDLTYMFRYNDLSGARKCIYAKTLDELRKKEVEINNNLSLGIYTTDWTLNQIFERYLDQNTKLKERTKLHYKIEYDRWVGCKWIGKRKISSIVKSDITRFYKEMSDAGFANGTIKCIHKFISGALNMAYDELGSERTKGKREKKDKGLTKKATNAVKKTKKAIGKLIKKEKTIDKNKNQ